jgi:predicted MFS family arabinose efflux permease
VAGGSVLGGLLLSVFPWSSIFWVNVPIGLVTVAITEIGVRESRAPNPGRLDVAGTALSAFGLLLITFGCVASADTSWHSPLVVACIAAGVAVLVAFVRRERTAAWPMVPPALLRTPSFTSACAVYLLAYLAFSGFIYYVTLHFQNVAGWSPLRTGLSWLFFCIPYFAVAQQGARLARRLALVWTVGGGCVVAAAGAIGMSQLTGATPFIWPAACYILVGVGFALMVPAASAAAMAEVPAGSSGIGSGLFNACRQVGTAIGLAILGSVGAAVIRSDWHRRTHGLVPASRVAQLGSAVAGGQVHLVEAAAGQVALGPALASFRHGFEVALVLSAAALCAAAAVAFRGLRHLDRSLAQPQPVEPAAEQRPTRFGPLAGPYRAGANG